MNAALYYAKSAAVDFGPLLLLLVASIVVVRDADRKRAPWLERYREWLRNAPLVVAAFMIFGGWLFAGSVLFDSSYLAFQLGLKPWSFPEFIILWSVLMGIWQAAFQTWITRKTEKGIVQDWLDWPEFKDKDLGVIR